MKDKSQEKVRKNGFFFIFFFNDTATTEIYTLSLHDALPIWPVKRLICIMQASNFRAVLHNDLSTATDKRIKLKIN